MEIQNKKQYLKVLAFRTTKIDHKKRLKNDILLNLKVVEHKQLVAGDHRLVILRFPLNLSLDRVPFGCLTCIMKEVQISDRAMFFFFFSEAVRENADIVYWVPKVSVIVNLKMVFMGRQCNHRACIACCSSRALHSLH